MSSNLPGDGYTQMYEVVELLPERPIAFTLAMNQTTKGDFLSASLRR